METSYAGPVLTGTSVDFTVKSLWKTAGIAGKAGHDGGRTP